MQAARRVTFVKHNPSPLSSLESKTRTHVAKQEAAVVTVPNDFENNHNGIAYRHPRTYIARLFFGLLAGNGVHTKRVRWFARNLRMLPKVRRCIINHAGQVGRESCSEARPVQSENCGLRNPGMTWCNSPRPIPWPEIHEPRALVHGSGLRRDPAHVPWISSPRNLEFMRHFHRAGGARQNLPAHDERILGTAAAPPRHVSCQRVGERSKQQGRM
jgi:hypothetical protein